MKHGKVTSKNGGMVAKATKGMGTTSTNIFSGKGMGKCYKPGKDTPRISRA